MTTHELAARLLGLPDVPVVLTSGSVIRKRDAASAFPDWSADAPAGWLVETAHGHVLLHLVERGTGADREYEAMVAGRVSLAPGRPLG